jgi:hypothetical protein
MKVEGAPDANASLQTSASPSVYGSQQIGTSASSEDSEPPSIETASSPKVDGTPEGPNVIPTQLAQTISSEKLWSRKANPSHRFDFLDFVACVSFILLVSEAFTLQSRRWADDVVLLS